MRIDDGINYICYQLIFWKACWRTGSIRYCCQRETVEVGRTDLTRLALQQMEESRSCQGRNHRCPWRCFKSRSYGRITAAFMATCCPDVGWPGRVRKPSLTGNCGIYDPLRWRFSRDSAWLGRQRNTPLLSSNRINALVSTPDVGKKMLDITLYCEYNKMIMNQTEVAAEQTSGYSRE